MDVREKLVDIAKRASYHCLPSNTQDFHINMFVTDLLARGVTVQELDGCEYCNDPHPARDCVLPDGTERFLAGFEDGTFLGKPFIYERKIKFCPMCGRRLPQPPKGE